jgi:predicted nucleic acid-binding protein
VEIRSPQNRPIVGQLDPGESEAIALAAEVHADVVLMDDQAGPDVRKPFAEV